MLIECISKMSLKQACIAIAVMRVKMSQLDRAGIELHLELCQAKSKSVNVMRHWYYHCRQQTLAYLDPTSNCQGLITYSHDHQHVSLGLVLLQPGGHSLQQLLYAATLLAAGEQSLQLLLF